MTRKHHPPPPPEADAGRPLRVALVGAGACGRMIARHLLRPVGSLRLVAVASRTVERAAATLERRDVALATTAGQVEDAVVAGRPCATADGRLLAVAPSVDLVIEATGTVEFGAGVVLAAIAHRKHVVLANAELDATLGPLLKLHADRAHVVYTNTDGDEPGVAMTLLRYLRSVGLRPVAAGNIKGMIDPHRTPRTQAEFARQHGQNPAAVTSFADGTKLAFEAAVLANATGFRVGRRGMFGPRCEQVGDLTRLLPLDRMLKHGLVDYALGAAPHSGAFVLTFDDDPDRCRELAYFKLGSGPLFAFHAPFHLPHVQIAASLRGAARGEATVAPLGAPVCEVAAVAKRDLASGETLDGVGGFDVYGQVENADAFAAADLLPIGVSAGCVLRRAVPADRPLTYDDICLPADRLCDRLRAEQRELLPVASLPRGLALTAPPP